VIGSFGDKRTEALFLDAFVPAFQGVARAAKRKLELVNSAARLDDLRFPPANRLERLKGKLRDYYSIRVNDQWRVIFRWHENDAYDVRVVDYH
jgi:proteic killer suppression protein